MRIPVTKILTHGAVGLAALLALSGCGSTTSTTSTPAAARAGSTTSDSSTTHASPSPTATTTATTSASSTSAAGPAACRAADLALSYLGGQGATGHGLLGFALRNTSSVSCRTYGYPGVQFLSRSGAHLPTTPVHTTNDFFGPSPLRPLIVAPGQSFSFRLGVTHGAASNAGCATAYGVQVIAPDDTATMSVSIPQGAYECGTATVSPVQPGTSAYR